MAVRRERETKSGKAPSEGVTSEVLGAGLHVVTGFPIVGSGASAGGFAAPTPFSQAGRG